jgi:hypothetical protein
VSKITISLQEQGMNEMFQLLKLFLTCSFGSEEAFSLKRNIIRMREVKFVFGLRRSATESMQVSDSTEKAP